MLINTCEPEINGSNHLNPNYSMHLSIKSLPNSDYTSILPFSLDLSLILTFLIMDYDLSLLILLNIGLALSKVMKQCFSYLFLVDFSSSELSVTHFSFFFLSE